MKNNKSTATDNEAKMQIIVKDRMAASSVGSGNTNADSEAKMQIIIKDKLANQAK